MANKKKLWAIGTKVTQVTSLGRPDLGVGKVVKHHHDALVVQFPDKERVVRFMNQLKRVTKKELVAVNKAKFVKLADGWASLTAGDLYLGHVYFTDGMWESHCIVDRLSAFKHSSEQLARKALVRRAKALQKKLTNLTFE